MLRSLTLLHALPFCLLLAAGPAPAQEAVTEPDGAAASGLPGGSGMPLPRFASLKSEQANMRTGPGTRYPIRYVYHRIGLPLEIVSEYNLWREVRDPDGESGWMHKSMLSGKRTAVLRREEALRRQPGADSPAVAQIAAGVSVTLEECALDWCQAEVRETRGWLPKAALWGVYPSELIED